MSPNSTPDQVRTVSLGASAVPAVGLGCMGMSWGYVDADLGHEQNVELIRDAVELGVRLFDTSDQYGPFTNELLVGEALEKVRARVFLATKGGLVVNSDKNTSRDGSPAHLAAALAASLERLRTDHVDLYQLHRVDPLTPLEHSWESMAGFVADGRAAAIGLSEVTVAELERAVLIHPVASVQSELSLWTRDALADVLPYCRENGITFIAYAPLGRGFLGGRIRNATELAEGDWRRRNARFQDEALCANRAAILDPIQECAQELGITTAQVAIAWVLAQGPNVVTIPGTQRRHYLQDNWSAGRITLPQRWIKRLNTLPAATGERY